MILLIDNYDSFTYNLYQYICELGFEVIVKRNDEISISEIREMDPSHIVLSPGPGNPSSAGISVSVVKELAGTCPILGVCLGHQSIGEAFGGKTVSAPVLMHGKTSLIRHDGSKLFNGVPDGFEATRYHSLVIDKQSLPDELIMSAWTDDGVIMAVRHKSLPVEGVQFHPESILTGEGKHILANFFGKIIPAFQGPESAPAKKKSPQADKQYAECMNRLTSRQDLSREETHAFVNRIMEGGLSDIRIAGFLMALRTKGETIDEITGAADAMLEKVTPVHTDYPALDTCGTGADRSGTFNVSTTAAFIAAGAGIPVAKHGNRSVTSSCGSADVLERLGVNITAESTVMEQAVNAVGIGFMFAPGYHPSMKYVMSARRELGLRSIFNILGPVANPANASFRVMGVFERGLLELLAQVLSNVGVKRGFVVHGDEGLDEISPAGLTHMVFINDRTFRSMVLDPKELGFDLVSLDQIQGGDAEKNASIVHSVLSGEKTPYRDTAVLNAAAGIVAAGLADNFGDAVALARDSIDSGKASAKLESLVRFSSQKG